MVIIKIFPISPSQCSHSRHETAKQTFFLNPNYDVVSNIMICSSPRLQTSETTRVLVVDEIGKMELFSRSFMQTVKDLLKNPKTTVFATIPVKANPFVDEIRNRDDVIVYTVSRSILSHHLFANCL